MDSQLADKFALVSGSSKGIGLAIATGLAREGARVIVNLVVYVCSPLSSATNGAVLRVDGGLVQACF